MKNILLFIIAVTLIVMCSRMPESEVEEESEESEVIITIEYPDGRIDTLNQY